MGDKFTSAEFLLTTCLDWAIAYGVAFATTRTLSQAHPGPTSLSARQGGECPADADRSGPQKT